jgi:NlpC/P60 family putative phage cell wall peptidase
MELTDEQVMRHRIVAEARSWCGTPYHHQGQVKGVGVDCAMLLVEVFHQVGLIPKIDTRPYPPDWHMHRSEERYLAWVEKYAKPVEDPQPGDIVVYKFGRCMSHGGIVSDWPKIIHSYFRQGCYEVRGDAGALGTRGSRGATSRERVFYSVFAK